MLLSEITNEIKYIKPNFIDEYNEVTFQPAINNIFKTKNDWLKKARNGKIITISSIQANKIANYDPTLKNLDHEKLERVKKIFKTKKVELPIILFDGKFQYLLAGNTRLAYARANNFPLKVWAINVPKLEEWL